MRVPGATRMLIMVDGKSVPFRVERNSPVLIESYMHPLVEGQDATWEPQPLAQAEALTAPPPSVESPPAIEDAGEPETDDELLDPGDADDEGLEDAEVEPEELEDDDALPTDSNGRFLDEADAIDD